MTTARRKASPVRFSLFAALAVLGFGTAARADGPVALPDILIGFSAKETCSCVFIADQSDEYCAEFGRTAGVTVQVAIDRGARKVTATFQGVSRSANADPSGACLLEGKPAPDGGSP